MAHQFQKVNKMESLSLITEQIREQYGGFESFVIPAEKLALTDNGFLSTGKEEFPFTLEGLDQFAGLAEIPKPFFRSLESDIRCILFNRRLKVRLNDNRITNHIRINLNQYHQIIGFDDPKLSQINPVKLMEVINSSLPQSLSAQKVMVGSSYIGTNRLHISCFSPEHLTEPRPGDVINGGIDIVHHISGESGTQISCYLRRLICTNGATTHICKDNKPLRVRRLPNERFDEADMFQQIHDRLAQAWEQIDEKLAAIKALTEKERTSLDFLEQHRTRLSLNNHMLAAIRKAITEDELGPTNTQYDLFNSIARVATHHQNLTFRQRRTLSRLAGEFSQQDIHRCDKCGSWLTLN